MKILNGQQIGLTCQNPFFLLDGPTLGTVPVAAAIVSLPNFPTTVACFNMPAHVRGTTLLYGIKAPEGMGWKFCFCV